MASKAMLWAVWAQCALLSLLRSAEAAKLLLIVVEGFPGYAYYKYSQHPAFRQFETEGAWSDLLYPQFPTYTLPNVHTIATGQIPAKHGIVGEFMFDESRDDYFMGGRHENDFRREWWNASEPLWVTASRQGLSAALFYWPACQVKWEPLPALCEKLVPASSESGLRPQNLARVLAATQDHDLVMAYHRGVSLEVDRQGPRDLLSNRSLAVQELAGMLKEALSHSQANGYNLVVLSDHGLSQVPHDQRRFLEDYLDMGLLRMTVGSGAVKQLIPQPGKAHEVFHRLRREAPIPNVKVYYTTEDMSDLPKWYAYPASDRVPDLVLVAQPGFAILTRDVTKQVPIPSGPAFGWSPAMSGYNNNYPEMLGLLLAKGPAFRRGYRKGPAHLLDLHPLFCLLLELQCPQGQGDVDSIADLLVSSRRPSKASVAWALQAPPALLALLLCSLLARPL